MNKIVNNYKIFSNRKLCNKFYHLCFDAKTITKKFLPGQFVHIKVNDGLEPFFRRPFSIYRASKHVEILYEVVGKGTKILSTKKKDDILNIMGPLGSSFSMPKKNVKQVIMIAGGVGVAPFMALSDVLKKKKCEVMVLYGGRSKDYVYDLNCFKRNGCKVFVSTDDGSLGVKGSVSKLFRRITFNPKETFIYTCGPTQMIASVQKFAKQNGLKGEASMESLMACGIGTCLGCAIKTKNGYKTVCNDGPVFDLNEIKLNTGE